MPRSELIGIEIGGTKLQVVSGDRQGNIDLTLEVAADSQGGGPAILRQLEEMTGQLLGADKQRIAGIGVGFGGPVNSMNGTVIKSNHVAGWENVSLREWAQTAFGLPCAIGNDTDVAAVAEARVGGGKHDRCVFYSNIGSGIGGGLVIDGALYTRPLGAMEFGYNLVYSELDGQHGILEEFCSGWSLNRRAQEAAQRDEHSIMWRLAGDDLSAIDAAILFAAWQEDDASATRIVDCFLDCYARAMSNVIALLNPDVLIIGGGVANVGSPLLEAICQRLGSFVYQPFALNYRVELTTLGARAVPVGALLLAAEL